jgi:hypothetical protein
MWVTVCSRQDILDNAPGQFTNPLVFLQHYLDRHSMFYIPQIGSICHHFPLTLFIRATPSSVNRVDTFDI